MTSLMSGTVRVETTSNTGHSPEFYANRVLEKLIMVSDTAPEPIRSQAKVFAEDIRGMVLDHIRSAMASERTTVSAELRQAGLGEAAKVIER